MGIAVDDTANTTKLFISDFASNSIKSVLLAGGTTASMTNASPAFNGPVGLALKGPNLYVVDSLNHAVRKATTAAPYTTLLYAGAVGTFGNTSGTFHLPRNAVFDALGNLYVTDSFNNAIRRINLSTTTVELMAGSSAGTAGNSIHATGTSALFSTPFAIAFATVSGAGTLFVSDQGSALIRKVSTTSPYPVSAFTLN
jgi:sugar lactone lactonase YvrE